MRRKDVHFVKMKFDAKASTYHKSLAYQWQGLAGKP
jgi:hypothetical protein